MNSSNILSPVLSEDYSCTLYTYSNDFKKNVSMEKLPIIQAENSIKSILNLIQASEMIPA